VHSQRWVRLDAITPLASYDPTNRRNEGSARAKGEVQVTTSSYLEIWLNRKLMPGVSLGTLTITTVADAFSEALL